MKIYAIYDENTGKILRIVRCAESHIGLQCTAGQTALEVAEYVTDSTHRVENGQIVQI